MRSENKERMKDYSEHRKEFETKGAALIAKVIENMTESANMFLDDVLEDFPFEEAWENTTREYRKTIKVDTKMDLARFYTILEIAGPCAAKRGLEFDYKVKEKKGFREVSLVMAGLKRCKDCRCCEGCGGE